MNANRAFPALSAGFPVRRAACRLPGSATGAGTGLAGTRNRCPSTPAPDFRTPFSRFRMPAPNFRTPFSRCRMPTPNFRTPFFRCRMPAPDFRVPFSRCRVPAADFRTPFFRCRVPARAAGATEFPTCDAGGSVAVLSREDRLPVPLF